MATLPTPPRDLTMEAVDLALEARANAEPPRPYLGMSGLGRSCARALWYDFRWASVSRLDAATIRRFEDGHRGEAVMAERLRLVEEVELHTEDPRDPGQQIGFSDLGGHLRGHADGVIRGLRQAPKTWHIWEHKAVNEKKQATLAKLKAERGEKAALATWDPVYHAQAQLYLHYSGLTRHYLTCSTPGERETVGVRTDADPQAAAALIEKARRIITAAEPPPRISERPDWYECRWCAHRAICHEGEVTQPSCRTCCHATPEGDGDGRWSCAKYGSDLATDTQRQGAACPGHLFIPAMLPWSVAEASAAEGWVEYERSDGTRLRNGPGGCTSAQLAASPEFCADPGMRALQTTMGATLQHLELTDDEITF